MCRKACGVGPADNERQGVTMQAMGENSSSIEREEFFVELGTPAANKSMSDT